MNKELKNITNLTKLIDKSITSTSRTLSYDRLINAIDLLAYTVKKYGGADHDWMYINDDSYTTETILIGAYWHLYGYNKGRGSASYRAMRAIRRVYNPKADFGTEPGSCESYFLDALNELADSVENLCQ